MNEGLENAERIAQEELQKRPSGHNNIVDALRHFSWMERVSREVDPFIAWVVGTGHEVDGLLRGQPFSEALMDLHNNHLGRRAGQGEPISPVRLWILPLEERQYNPYSEQ